MCGANEPITDSLSENESEETHIHMKHQGKIRSLFRKTHISGFVNKKIGTIEHAKTLKVLLKSSEVHNYLLVCDVTTLILSMQ